MKKTSEKSMAVLILVVLIMMSMVSCFTPQVPPTGDSGNSSSDGTEQTPSTPERPDDSNNSHICDFGEWEIVKDATNTEDGLMERKCSCGNVEQKTISASNKEYYIQYKNIKTADYPTENGYNSDDGLLDLPTLDVEGYKFVGWYTASVGGELVDYIPEGSTQNYILYAHWELIEYTITYVDASVHTNPLTYSIENDTIILSNPVWSGLSFAYWTNENGDKVTQIEKGSVGNIKLTANWLLEENYAITTDDDIPEDIVFDEETNRYYFIYELGEIDNVVVGVVDSQDKLFMESLTFSKSSTITIEKGIADTISETVSKSISKTQGWSQSCSLTESYSRTKSDSVSAEIGIQVYEIGGKIGASSSVSSTVGFSATQEFGTYASETVTSTNEQTASSTVSYAKGQSTTVTAASTIDGAMPKGTYSYVVVAKVKVFGIVTYDVLLGTYYLDTFSVMDEELREKRLYEAPIDSTANITSCDELTFDITKKDFKEYVESYYYIQYDPNCEGEQQKMHLSIVELGTEPNLRANTYVRNGHIFTGWSSSAEVTNVEYEDEAVISNLADGGEVVTLYAQWIESEKTIVLGNGDNQRHIIRKWSSWGNDYDDHGEDSINPEFDIETLKKFGCTKFSITISFRYKVEDWGDQRIRVITNKGATISKVQHEWDERGWTTSTITLEASFDYFENNGGFTIIWDLFEDGVNSDTWIVGQTNINIKAN